MISYRSLLLSTIVLNDMSISQPIYINIVLFTKLLKFCLPICNHVSFCHQIYSVYGIGIMYIHNYIFNPCLIMLQFLSKSKLAEGEIDTTVLESHQKSEYILLSDSEPNDDIQVCYLKCYVITCAVCYIENGGSITTPCL